MSWLFSRALVEEYSADSCSGGEPCAPLSVMSTAHSFWRRGKTIDASSLSLFGLTCAVLTEDRGKGLLMSYLEASRARTSAPLAKGPESVVSARDCGLSSPESFAKFDRSTHSWRTAQPSLLGDSTLYSGTWPRSVSMRKGVCSQHRTLGSATNAKGTGSLLPTPSGVNGGRNNTMGRIDEWGGSSNPLRGTVIGSMCSEEFEELVMGWPIGWTELTPFETGKFQEWLHEHSENCTPDSLQEAA
jgi:hypothetical protein